MKILNPLMPIILIASLACCCSSKKQKSSAAMDALPNRNIQDPKLENRPPRAELMDSSNAVRIKRNK